MRLEEHQKRRTIVVRKPVCHGVEGCGAPKHVHTTRRLSLPDDLPTAVAIVDGVMCSGRSAGRT